MADSDCDADVEGPRLVHAEEFDAVGEAMNRCFNLEADGFQSRWPHCFDREHPDRHAAIWVDGEVAAHVGVVPQTLVAGETAVDCWGITSVGTLVPYRGRGFMTDLLEFWLDRFDAEGVPLSDLGGDRQRYNRFGWEHAGRERVFRVTGRSLPADEANTPHPDVRPYDGSVADRALVADVHDAERLRVARDDDDYRAILGKRGVGTLCYDGEDGPAYLSFDRESADRRVPELGGSAAGVEALLGHLLHAWDTESLTVRLPPGHPRESTVQAVSSRWRSEPNRLYRVGDLAGTLDAFAPQIGERVEASGELTLGVESGETARVTYAPGEVTVERATGEAESPDLSVERPAAARLLFGGGYAETPADPLLDALPVECYVWPSDAV
jgi:GNAT superfamily N-acetyltransferase